MNPLVEEKISSLHKFIEQVKLTEQDVDLVQYLMPGVYIWIDHEVNVSWTVNSIEDVKKVLRSFAELGVRLAHFTPSPSQPAWKLAGLNAFIRLNPTWKTNDEDENASCKLVQTGVETYPIYKLVCDGKDVSKTAENLTKEEENVTDTEAGQQQTGNVPQVQEEVPDLGKAGDAV